MWRINGIPFKAGGGAPNAGGPGGPPGRTKEERERERERERQTQIERYAVRERERG